MLDLSSPIHVKKTIALVQTNNELDDNDLSPETLDEENVSGCHDADIIKSLGDSVAALDNRDINNRIAVNEPPYGCNAKHIKKYQVIEVQPNSRSTKIVEVINEAEKIQPKANQPLRNILVGELTIKPESENSSDDATSKKPLREKSKLEPTKSDSEDIKSKSNDKEITKDLDIEKAISKKLKEISDSKRPEERSKSVSEDSSENKIKPDKADKTETRAKIIRVENLDSNEYEDTDELQSEKSIHMPEAEMDTVDENTRFYTLPTNFEKYDFWSIWKLFGYNETTTTTMSPMPAPYTQGASNNYQTPAPYYQPSSYTSAPYVNGQPAVNTNAPYNVGQTPGYTTPYQNMPPTYNPATPANVIASSNLERNSVRYRQINRHNPSVQKYVYEVDVLNANDPQNRQIVKSISKRVCDLHDPSCLSKPATDQDTDKTPRIKIVIDDDDAKKKPEKKKPNTSSKNTASKDTSSKNTASKDTSSKDNSSDTATTKKIMDKIVPEKLKPKSMTDDDQNVTDSDTIKNNK